MIYYKTIYKMGGRPSCPVCPGYIKIVDFKYFVADKRAFITLFKSSNPEDTLAVSIDGTDFTGDLTLSPLKNGDTELSFITLLNGGVDGNGNVIRVSLTDASNTVSDEVTYKRSLG